ncbi:MAG TPA: YihY/virulence factor BrkB family protein [Rhodopila sp.]|nr:YihY/virulence factor BrkB family protein [Rhodopila sp.]
MAATKRLGEMKRDLDSLREPPDAPRYQPDTETTPQKDRGRAATDPRHIPAPGWKDILVRSWREISDNSIFLVAGGVTYSILAALFPGLAALVSVYGLFLDPKQVEEQLKALSNILPQDSMQMISSELHSLVSHSSQTLGIGAVVSLVLALWFASRGMSGMINALNIAYDEKETRGFFKLNLLAILLTVMLLVGGTITIALVGVLPAAVGYLGLGVITKWLLLILEWPLLIAVVLTGLAALYRYAPDREKPQWRWVSPGAITATVLWLIGSLLFTVYVTHFNSYNKTYGSLGGIFALLTWLWLSSFVALFGAVINAQSERQTVADSTVAEGKPLGDRDAFAADTVGRKTS